MGPITAFVVSDRGYALTVAHLVPRPLRTRLLNTGYPYARAKDADGTLTVRESDAFLDSGPKGDPSCGSDQLADMTHLLIGLQHIFNSGDEAYKAVTNS
jgi:hypothetical protein